MIDAIRGQDSSYLWQVVSENTGHGGDFWGAGNVLTFDLATAGDMGVYYLSCILII